MEWTPENIYLLRKHLDETQQQFAERMGLRRANTVLEWEAGRLNPSGAVRRLLDICAKESGFTDRVAAKLREKLKGTE